LAFVFHILAPNILSLKHLPEAAKPVIRAAAARICLNKGRLRRPVRGLDRKGIGAVSLVGEINFIDLIASRQPRSSAGEHSRSAHLP
jgi:hypothetical protein